MPSPSALGDHHNAHPHPCGHEGNLQRVCTCSFDRIERYRARISGPLLDRFDIHIALRPVESRTLREGERGERSAEVRARVQEARARAQGRALNAEQLSRETSSDALHLLDRAVDGLGLSVRAYVKALRVARTIAHLDDSAHIEAPHMAEAIQYRLLDRREEPAVAAPSIPEVSADRRGSTQQENVT